jgi:hypothetical protein
LLFFLFSHYNLLLAGNFGFSQLFSWYFSTFFYYTLNKKIIEIKKNFRGYAQNQKKRMESSIINQKKLGSSKKKRKNELTRKKKFF